MIVTGLLSAYMLSALPLAPAVPRAGILPGEARPALLWTHPKTHPKLEPRLMNLLVPLVFGLVQPPAGAEVPVITLPPEVMVPQRTMAAVAAGPDWGVAKVGAPAAWAAGNRGRGVVVAVLDTGIDAGHPAFAGRVKATKDFTRSRTGPDDRQGHGTHCAGSVLAGGELPGVAPEATLLVGKVLDDSGSGGVDGIAQGIRWAVDQGADVISLSLGGSGRDSFIPPALDYAIAKGVIVVVAAGNSGPGEGTIDFPGGYPQSLAVAAVDANLAVARFSSRGANVFVAGPGVNVTSTYPRHKGGGYATMSGTSMATPHVAGEAALWVSANPGVAKVDRPAKFREWVKAVARDLPPAGRDTATGFGFTTVETLAAKPKEPDPKPGPTLEDRVRELERRVAALEKLAASKPMPGPGGKFTSYAGFLTHVLAGNPGVLVVGPAPAGVGYDYQTDALQGVAPGVYDCTLGPAGPQMTPRAGATWSHAPKRSAGLIRLIFDDCPTGA